METFRWTPIRRKTERGTGGEEEEENFKGRRKVINKVEISYIKLIATIGLHQNSDETTFKKSLRRSDTISPACLEEVFKNLIWKGIGFKNDGEHLNNLMFTDNIVLLSESEDILQKMIEELNRESLKVGLKLSIK